MSTKRNYRIITFIVFIACVGIAMRMLTSGSNMRARDVDAMPVQQNIEKSSPGFLGGTKKSYGPFCRAHKRRRNKYYDDHSEESDPQSRYYKMRTPLVFTDPVNCQVSEASFTGVNWFRDAGVSNTTGSMVRGRSLALVVADTAGVMMEKDITCLNEVRGLSVLNTESKGPLHETLRKLPLPRYEATEFCGNGEHKSGDMVKVKFSGGKKEGKKVRHEDLQGTSFESESFDMVISTEVFEHIPHPYQAHREVYRILKRGGAHVFTNPFLSSQYPDLVASSMTADGNITHHVNPPMYHGDPLRPLGVLVFTLFGWELVTKLCDIGFDVEVVFVRNPKYGVVGSGAYHFIAWKR